MRNIEIVFCRPKNFFVPMSWLIRLFQGWTKYSHCAFKFSIAGRSMYYEAKMPQVSLSNEKYFLARNTVTDIHEIELDDLQYSKLRDLVMSYSGVPYPSLELISLGVSKLLKLKKNFYCRKDEMKCSELIGNIISELYKIQLDTELLTVKDLKEIIEIKKA